METFNDSIAQLRQLGKEMHIPFETHNRLLDLITETYNAGFKNGALMAEEIYKPKIKQQSK